MSEVHEHLAPEELTELAAMCAAVRAAVLTTGDERLADARRAALACPVCAAELSELERFLSSSRSALERATRVPERESADLAERILARTTRQDPAWRESPWRDKGLRGDVRLLGSFVATRLRSSRVLRLAAASLLAHLFALPVLAWYILEQRDEPAIWITIAPPAEEVEWAASDEERLPPLVVPAMDSSIDETLLVSADPEPIRIENSVRLARFDLSRGAPAMPPAARPDEDLPGEDWPDEDPVERLLRTRAERVASFAAGRELPELRFDGEQATALERVLAVDIRLDEYVLGDRDPDPRGLDRGDGLAAALDGLCGDGSTAPEIRLLEAAALARAEAYGLLNEAQRGRLGAQRRLAAERSDALALELLGSGRDASAYRTAPLGEAWITALVGALPPRIRERAVARAWGEHARQEPTRPADTR